jgi:hypothetical protein
MKANFLRHRLEGQRAKMLGSRSRTILGESLIFLAFVALTIAMTWPWVLHLRDSVSDPGDPYLIAWIMWWDYFQTFHDPVNLFQAPIFYPYSYALAYSENSYGIALLFFPLYALGLRPLTAVGLATLLGFATSGYSAFRLARTITGSTGVAWVAGIVFGFALYRFATISHLSYLFAGWIPLTLEALVLFLRRPTWRRAGWLGLAFTMNALSCIHWFVLTLIPFALSGAYLLTRYELWGNRQMWKRLIVSLALSAIVLLPFLLPYQRVAKLQGTVRSVAEAATYSASARDWLAATPMNKLWRGFGPVPDTGERHLFPGILPILLILSAFFLSRSRNAEPNLPRDAGQPVDFNQNRLERDRKTEPSRRLLIALDVLAITSLFVALLAYGYQGIKPFGLKQLHVPDETRPLAVFVLVFFVRLCLAYPQALRPGRDRNLVDTARRLSEPFGIGMIWIVLGFFGSLGMNFFFHRWLFEYIFIFRSIRVPARWAMIAMLGIALLAGLGAQKIATAVSARWPNLRTVFVYAIICGLLLFEARSAPLLLFRGEVDPDAVTLYLRKTPMRGGIAHLPSGVLESNHRYVLRQADHRRPLITAFSGFSNPIIKDIETLSQSRPIPDRFFDLLEQIPTSYLVVHDSILPPAARPATREMLARGVVTGRLRFIGEFAGTGINGNEGAQLFAVTKTEPNAQSLEAPPAYLVPHELSVEARNDPTMLVTEFDRWGFPLYLFYKVSYNRAPRYDEFIADAEATGRGVTLFGMNWEQHLQNNFRSFAAGWIERPAFKKEYADKTAEQYVNQLLSNAGVTLDESQRMELVDRLKSGAERRVSVLLKVISNESVIRRERNPALLLLHYFGYLRRNPDDPPDKGWEGFNYWLNELEKTGDPGPVTRAFMLSGEYKRIKEGDR